MSTKLQVLDESSRAYDHPLYEKLLDVPGLSVAVGSVDQVLTWGLASSLWIFPMATSCCGIELMAAAASRVDLDRMGTIVRASPRQADVMIVAGTITVKMAPRVKKLWDQMPEPKWCIAMGSCAISGDFYRDLYPVVPGIDTFLPVDVYVPGCPPNPEGLMHGLLQLKDMVQKARLNKRTPAEPRNKDLIPEMWADALKPSPVPEEQPTEVDDVEPVPAAAIVTEPDVEALYRAHGATEIPTNAPPFIPTAQHVPLARALVERGFRQLVAVVASHWPAGRGRGGPAPEETEHYEVAYIMRSLGAGSRVATWTVRVEAGATLPSLSPVLAGADWQEREQYDLVGVRFSGHPDLRRLMLPDDWEGHPLRKDYAADAHRAPWR